MEPNVPRPNEVRNRIEQAGKLEHRVGLMYGFLVAGRVSEIVGRACPSDMKYTTPRGPRGEDFEVTETRVNDVNYEVVVFNVKTSKRDGILRAIGLPLDPEYEPWAKPILEYFGKFDKDDLVFPFTRQDLFPTAKKVFGDLMYPIEEYTIQSVDQDKFNELLSQVPEPLRHLVKVPNYLRTEEKVQRHHRYLRLHGACRHYRTMELISRFQFTKEQRKTYLGHTIDVTDRYGHLDWYSYFPKLLKKSY